jgi:hypothetical protein
MVLPLLIQEEKKTIPVKLPFYDCRKNRSVTFFFFFQTSRQDDNVGPR